MSNTYTQVFGGQALPSSGPSYSAVTLTANTQFYWPELAVGPAVMTDIMEVSCATELQLAFPDASVVSVGRTVLIRNVGVAQIGVVGFTGAGITTVAPGVMKYIYLSDNSTVAGVWGNITFGAGTSAVDAGTLVGAGLKSIGTTLNQIYPTTSQSGNVTLTSSALAKTNVFSGSGAVTCNLPAAATAGDGFFTLVANQGTGSVIIDPNSSELIDGEATKTLVPGESLMVVCNGALWVTIGYGRSTQFQFTKLVYDISSGTPFTLTSAQASNKILNFVGTATGPITVNVPAVVAIYYVQNTYSGAFSLTIKTAAGTGIVLSNSDLTILYCDGTNVVNAQTVVAPASNLAGGFAGVVPYQAGVGSTGFSASGIVGNLFVSGGSGAPTWSDIGVVVHGSAQKAAPVETDEMLLADSASSFTGKRLLLSALKSILSIGFKNRLFNGRMVIDQRNVGTSKTYTAGGSLLFGVDRWYAYCTGANITGQQITTSAGQKRYRFTGSAGNTGLGFGQRIEAANSLDLASSTVTLQAKLSSSSITIVTWAVYYANTTNTFGTIASPTRTSIASGTWTISAAETVYSTSISVPAAATTGLEVLFTTGALVASQTFTVGDVQLEAGGLSSPEVKSFAGDLIDCSRYYFKTYPYAVVPGTAYISGLQLEAAASTNFLRITSMFPTRMYSHVSFSQIYAPITGTGARCSIDAVDTPASASFTDCAFYVTVNNSPVTIGQIMSSHLVVEAEL